MNELQRFLDERARENAKLPLDERVRRFVSVNETEGMRVVVSDDGDAKRLLVLDGGVVEAEVLMREGEVTQWL